MPKILIVDDEEDIRNALAIYLRAEDYETVSAGDGQEALSILKEGGIDLVLLDIMMPGMDGITALSKLRDFSNVPVILLTAKSEESSWPQRRGGRLHHEALQSGGSDCPRALAAQTLQGFRRQSSR